MRYHLTWCLTSLCLMLFSGLPSGPLCAKAQDMRAINVQAEKARAALEKKAEAERQAALREDELAVKAIMENRGLLEKRLAKLKAQNSRLRTEVRGLEREAGLLSEKETAITDELNKAVDVVHELVGVVRMDAKDIDTFVAQNLQSGLYHPDTSFLQALMHESQFPDMDDVRHMVDILKAQISETGGVIVREGTIVGRDGHEVTATILLIGPFTAAYRHGDETGFLAYSATGRKFYALSKLPPSGMRNRIERYIDGKSDEVPVDISRGGALRGLTYSLSLWEQILKGGPVVWPILAVLIVGIFIIGERVVFLARGRIDSDALISDIEQFARAGEWDRCMAMCRGYSEKPLARVMTAGVKCVEMGREEVENALQEAILREIPSMERFLSALGMLAAIAPLLGLLGTVTGMINTFHVITLYGTGDPRLMSAGISEALVTTMLGLSVAIPLMLCHNLLDGAVERSITDMEEKGVALINIILKGREHGGDVEPA